MQILSGPPGSDLVGPLLDEFRGSPGSWLIVPTATMGEHLRNSLAREGRVVRPSSITTFSKLMNGWTSDLRPAAAARLEWLAAELLHRPEMHRFERLRAYPGFRRALIAAIEELSAAGATSDALLTFDGGSELHRSVRLFFMLLESACEERGWTLRRDLLLTAAARAAEDPRVPGRLFFAGFYSFTPGELAVVEMLAGRAHVTIGLPEWSGAAPALEHLRERGAVEIPHKRTQSPVLPRVVSAATHDTEAEEIARRILEIQKAGTQFRDIGIVVRSEEPYVPVLRSVLDRFGIPARFYFGGTMANHAVTRLLGGCVEALLTGWDHATLLKALRVEGSPMACADAFEFDVMERLPGSGLAALTGLLPPDLLQMLESMEGWRNTPQSPQSWAEALARLASIYRARGSEMSRSEALLWRERAAALESWTSAAGEAAELLATEKAVPVDRFWRAMALVLEQTELRVPDHRRDVVHVLDAFEARQWRLPAVFVCGLYERHFPHYTAQNPILDDAARLALREHGIHLRTSLERQEDEKFLFDVVCTHATRHLVLSYPRLDAKGNDRLRSFFLRDVDTLEESAPVHPAPAYFGRTQPHGIRDERLLTALSTHFASFSVSAMDNYLQCPFVFFTRRTLRLQEPPRLPGDRFGFALQGILAHGVLERVYREGFPLDQAFDEEFEKLRSRERLPDNYRTEAIRLSVYDDLLRFLQESALPPNAGAVYEHELNIEVDGIALKGRADRVEFDSQGRAIVIDYKYKARANLKQLCTDHEEGRNVQAGLYLRAMRREFDVAGMIFAGLRGENSYGGWVLPGIAPGLNLREVTSKFLDEEMQRAYAAAINVITGVRAGNTRPDPADSKHCRYCESSSVCRVEEQKLVVLAGGQG